VARALFLYALAGALSGLLAAGVAWLLKTLEAFWLGEVLGFLPPGPSGEGGLGQAFVELKPWAGVLVFPLLYALASLLGSNRGLSRLILAFREGESGPLMPQLRYVLGSLAELPAGSPLGREGPMTVLGDWLGRRLGRQLAPEEASAMGHAGLAAGFAAAFHAPLAGALLATEIFYRTLRLEAEKLTPALLGAFAGFAVYGGFFGYGPLFKLAPKTVGQAELWGALPLVILAALAANLWGEAIHHCFRHGQRLRFWQRHLVLGLFLGLAAAFVPAVLGAGYGWLELGALPLLSTQALALLFLLRYLLTVLFLGLGGYGAPLTPALVLGGLLGLVYARALPWPLDPEAMALAGIVTWLAGSARTPLAAVAFASELAGYRILPIALLAAALGYTLVRRPLFSEQAD